MSTDRNFLRRLFAIHTRFLRHGRLLQVVFVNSSCSTCLTISETGLTRSAATFFLMQDLILPIIRAPAAGLWMKSLSRLTLKIPFFPLCDCCLATSTFCCNHALPGCRFNSSPNHVICVPEVVNKLRIPMFAASLYDLKGPLDLVASILVFSWELNDSFSHSRFFRWDFASITQELKVFLTAIYRYFAYDTEGGHRNGFFTCFWFQFLKPSD